MTLTPTLASKLADGVYGIRDLDPSRPDVVAQGFARRNVDGVDGEFDLSRSTVVQGTSGGRVLNRDSGFAVVMPGGTGRSGEVAVAVRGTVTGWDWLTNLSAGVGRGPGGQMVHAGFNRVAASIIDATHAALEGTRPSHIHVVGHSLGGAVASLVASHVHGRHGGNVELYTFGAPRVGLPSFSQTLTQDLPLPIRRVYNPSDVVPMVPLFPFRHAPMPGDGMSVQTGHGMLSIDAHFMSSYGPVVSGKSWAQLASASSQQEGQIQVETWLGFAQEHSIIPGSTLALHALSYALRGIVELVQRSLGLTVTAGLTLLDGLAWLLVQAARSMAALGARITTLLRTILRFAGNFSAVPGNLTAQFIRHVLGLLLRPLAAIARRAFTRIDQGVA